MSNLFTFKKRYFIIAALIFLAEVLIALYVDDKFIRPYVGDFLVVILIYCFIRSFLNLPVNTLALSALFFAYLVETLQYLDILDWLGLRGSKLARTLLGSSFEWTDMAAYTLGIVLVLILERRSSPAVPNKKAENRVDFP